MGGMGFAPPPGGFAPPGGYGGAPQYGVPPQMAQGGFGMPPPGYPGMAPPPF